MNSFTNSDGPLSRADILSVQRDLGVQLAPELVDFYLSTNGGEPERYVLARPDIRVETSVTEFLPLRSDRPGVLTAADVYRSEILERRLLPTSYFPFAVDGGGDFFYLDSDSERCVLYRHDTIFEKRIPLDVSLSDFIESLVSELD